MSGLWKTGGMAALILAALIPVARPETIPGNQTFRSAWNSAGFSTREVPFPRRIVNVRDFGACGNGVSNDAAAFHAAITSLNGQAGVVFVPAGNYCLRSALTLRSGVVLRGESPTNTTLTFDTNVVKQGINVNGSGFGTWQFVSSGASQFSTQVAVPQVGVFSVGQYVGIRMYCPGSWELSPWATNSIGQIARVTTINGPVVTIDQPLRLDYGSYVPQIAPLGVTTNVGIENLKITRELTGTASTRNNIFTIRFIYAADCWVRGCDLYKCFGAHVGAEYSTHLELRGNYVEEAYEYDGGGSGYGFRFEDMSCENLVENNIFRKLRHSMLNQTGANGNVWGYNDSRDGRNEWGLQTSEITMHGNYPFANLAEGNTVSFIALDDSHGWNGPYNTFFRNKATHTLGIQDESKCRQEAYVGNETAGLFTPTAARGFCYGNTKSSGFVEASSRTWSNLWDCSYYRSTDPGGEVAKPSWWAIASSHLRPIGPTNGAPNFAAAKFIPAQSRYDAGGLLTVAPPSVKTLPPATVQAVTGSAVTLSALAYGSPSVSYVWFKDGTAIGGATGSSLTLTGVSAADAGTYTVSFTDAGGSVTSPPTALSLSGGAAP